MKKRNIIECRLRSWFYWQIVIDYARHMKAIAWKYGDTYYSVPVDDEYKFFEGHIKHTGSGVAVIFGNKKIYIIHKDKYHVIAYPNTIVPASYITTNYAYGILSIIHMYRKSHTSRFLVGSIFCRYNLLLLTYSKITYVKGNFEVFTDANVVEYNINGYEVSAAGNLKKYDSDDVARNDDFWTDDIASSTAW